MCERSPCDRCKAGHVLTIIPATSTYTCSLIPNPPDCPPAQRKYFFGGLPDIFGPFACIEHIPMLSAVEFGKLDPGFDDRAPCGTPGPLGSVTCNFPLGCFGPIFQYATFPKIVDPSVDPPEDPCVPTANFCSNMTVLNDCTTCATTNELLVRSESTRISCGCKYGYYRHSSGSCQPCPLSQMFCKCPD